MSGIVQWDRRQAVGVLLAGGLVACGGSGHGEATEGPGPSGETALAFAY